MQIAIDLSAYSSSYKGGVSSFSFGLIRSLILTKPKNLSLKLIVKENEVKNLLQGLNTDIEIVFFKESYVMLTKSLYKLVYNGILPRIFFSLALKIEYMHVAKFFRNVDFLYVPTTYVNYCPRKVKAIISLHDIQEKTYPHFFDKKQLKYRDVRTLYTLKKAYAIQTSSYFITQQIKLYYKEISKQIKFWVIPEGVETKRFSLVPNLYSADKSINIFYPAANLPHKNHKYLFDAIYLLNGRRSISLVLTGNSKNDFREFLTEKHQNLNISVMGQLSDDEILKCYFKADITVITSYYESSSLPILEALSIGCNVFASNIPAHIEMAENLPIILFDLNSPSNLTNLLMNFQSKQKLTPAAIHSYDWEIIAKTYWNYIKENIVSR